LNVPRPCPRAKRRLRPPPSSSQVLPLDQTLLWIRTVWRLHRRSEFQTRSTVLTRFNRVRLPRIRRHSVRQVFRGCQRIYPIRRDRNIPDTWMLRRFIQIRFPSTRARRRDRRNRLRVQRLYRRVASSANRRI
jgi:hypothetical protein